LNKECKGIQPLSFRAQVYAKLPYADSPGVPEGMQMAAAAHVLSQIPPADQELLLLMAALLRHIVKASGPGCEPEIVQIGR
jgi:hypothetical protein